MRNLRCVGLGHKWVRAGGEASPNMVRCVRCRKLGEASPFALGGGTVH